MFSSIGYLLKGAALGAGCMYLFDPDRGRRRRAGVADKATHLVREVDDLWQKGCRDLTNRSVGLASETRRMISAAPVDDQMLVARVRSVLGHHVHDARHVEASAQHGTVTLTGTVRPGEPECLIPAIERVPGVRSVLSGLVTAGEPVQHTGGHRGLTPAVRLLMTAGGGLMMANCLVRRGFGPTLLGAAGCGLFIRGLSDRPGRLVGLGEDRGIDFRKSIHIAAPVEKVFEFISDAEQTGRFLPEVVDVESLGNGRIRWSVEGPGGIGRFSCDEQVVESVENERIVWASVEDAPIRYIGEARFIPDGEGTRLDLRMTYEPPGGVLTHAAAAFLGVDPKTQVDRSLNRVKQHLEEGTIPQSVAGGSAREHRG